MSDNNSHAELGTLTQTLFDLLLGVFQLPDAGLIIGLCILGAAVLVVVGMWLKFSVLSLSLKRTLKLIEKKKNRDEFTHDFELIHQHFTKSKPLKRAWIEFDETLIQPPENSNFTEPRYQVIQNTRRPHEYFNTQFLPALRIRPVIAASTFVGVGLLLTFIGLVAALTQASTAFSDTNANSDTIELAINNLLIVAGAKFFSSIGGLGASILVSVFAKFLQSRIDTLTHDLCDTLESRLWFVSQTQVASDQYAHAIRQTARLEELKDQLAVSIGEQLSQAMQNIPEQLAGAVGSQIQPIAAAINNMSDNMGAQMGQAIAQSAGGASAEAREATETSMNSIAEQLNTVGERLEKATRGITTSGTVFGQQVAEGAITLKDNMNEGATQFSSLVTDAQATAKSLSTASEQLYQASSTVKPMLDTVLQAQRDANEAGKTQQELLTVLQQDLVSTKENMDENAARTELLIKSLESLWSRQAEQLQLNDTELENAFQQIERMTRQSTQQLNEQLTSMDSTLGSIVSHLNNSQANLIEAVEALDDTVGKLAPNNAAR